MKNESIGLSLGKENDKMTNSGICGDNLNWVLEDGTLTIFGTGDMYDYHPDDYAPWHGCDVFRVEIQQGITSIGENAFRDCNHLTSIEIPDGVSIIFEDAFFGCDSLMSVTLPASIGVICSSFSNCSSLMRFNVEEGNENYCDVEGVLFSMDKRALIQCPPGLPGAYNIPEGVTAIDDYAFEDCRKLKIVSFPASVKEIGDNVFYGCSSGLIIRFVGGSYAEDWYEKRKMEVKWEPWYLPENEGGRFGRDVFGMRVGMSTAECCISNKPFTSIQYTNRKEYNIKRIFQHGGDSDWESYEKIRQNSDGTDQLLCYMDALYTNFHWINVDQSLGNRWLRMQLVQRQLLDSLRKNRIVIRNGVTWAKICGWPWLVKYDGTEVELDISAEYQALVEEGFFKDGNRYDEVHIAPCAFRGCRTLESVRLPAKVASIQEYAFADCPNLKAVHLMTVSDSGVSSDAFEGCSDELTLFLGKRGFHKTVEECAENLGIRFEIEES